MERLTKDTPQENFETMMNFVFSQDGWAHILHDGEREDVPLTEWAKEQCLNRDCTYMKGLTIAKEIDDTLCDCLMDGDGCPVALSYCFACQASHLRDRLKAIEDILGDEYDLEHLRELNQADKSGRLVVPPCKERDTVYYIEAPHGQWRYYKLRRYTVSHLIISNDGVCVMARELTAPGMCLCRGEDFGRTAFIHEEDAKKRLDELNKEADHA